MGIKYARKAVPGRSGLPPMADDTGSIVTTPPVDPDLSAALKALAKAYPTTTKGGRPAKRMHRLKMMAKKTEKSYVAFFQTSPMERIRVVREGVAARVVPTLAADLGLDRRYLVDQLGLASSTLSRKMSDNARLSSHDSESVLGLAQVVGLVEAMVAESGGPEGFDAATWVGDWITRPHPALGHIKPAELLDTGEGLQLVMQVLQQSQTGAYA